MIWTVLNCLMLFGIGCCLVWLFRRLEVARAKLRAIAERNDELEKLFDLRWNADMRAIKRWREAHPGNELSWPDHADMVVWLLDQLAWEIETAQSRVVIVDKGEAANDG